MKKIYQNFSNEELLKKRALGTEGLTIDAQNIIAEILTERGVKVPPLFEKSIKLDDVRATANKNSTKWDYLIAFAVIAAGLIVSEGIKGLFKETGLIINLVFLIPISLVWIFYNISKRDKTREEMLEDKVGIEGFNELMKCATNGDVERIKELIEYKADVNRTDYKGYTALMYAAANGKIEVVKLLLKCGANKEIQTDKGLSLIHI